jgi:hypothetical protein
MALIMMNSVIPVQNKIKKIKISIVHVRFVFTSSCLWDIHPSVFRNVTHIVKLQISNEQALDVATVMDVLDNMNKHPLKGLYFP